MSLTTPYQEHYYIADGQTTRFSFGEYFSAPASDNVKCIIYFENGTTSVPTFTVNTTAGYIDIVSLTPPAGSTVRVFRDTPEQQNVTASQLQNYTAKQLEKIFDSIVAMIQENGYTTEHKTLRLTETQRDVLLGFLKESNEGALLYWDNENKTLTPTDFPKEDVVRCVNGLFFRVSTTQAGIPYLEWSVNGSSDWHSSSATWGTIDGNINNQTDLKNALDAKQNTISDLSTIRSGASKGATSVQPGDNISVLNNNTGFITASYHDATKQDLLVSGTNIKTINGRDILGSGDITISSSVAWGNIQGTLTDQTDLKNALDLKADVATTYTKTEVNTALSGKANTDMDNLTATGQNIANWSSNVTNCITEIPQDINLELNNGTLTLKAGSKYYIPNGAGVFDVVTLSADKTSTNSNNGKRLLFMQSTGYIYSAGINLIYSGATDPAAGTPWHAWYDTTNNTIIVYGADGTTPVSYTLSLPLAILTVSNGAISSIDQVFNGFGYIGNAVFALPGVKGLAPNGRNVDGTLKTIEMSLTSVFIGDISSSLPDDSVSFLTTSSVFAWPVIVQDNEPEIHSGYEVWYSPKLNLAFYHAIGETSWAQRPIVMFGNVAKTSTAFTKFEPGTPFRAVDYNDFANLSNEVVRTSGDQTIGGTKTFTGNNTFTGSNEFTQTVKAPSVYGYGSDSVRTASLEFIDGGNDNIARLVAVSNNGGNAATADLHFNNGSPYFSVPSSDAVNAAVATVAINKAQSGYVKLSNGIIIQWLNNVLIAQNTAYNLPTAFTSGTSYVAIATKISNSTETMYPYTTREQTSTTVAFNRCSGMGNDEYVNILAIGY